VKTFRISIRTQALAWSDRKVVEMKREILQLLAQYGAPNCEWKVEDSEPIPARVIKMRCTWATCASKGEPWEDETITPCPTCGRRTVEKVKAEAA